jgi:putative transposase
MGRKPRNTLPGGYYHCVNRGVGRRTIFHDRMDFEIFIYLMKKSQKRYPLDISSFCLMPNHWHIVLSAESGTRLSHFFSSLLNSHTRSYHAKYDSIGQGPIYQGRYKSILVPEESVHSVCRYVERNPVASNLVTDAKDWRWSSFNYWAHGSNPYRLNLSRPFFEDQHQWAAVVNTPLS